MHQTEYSKNDFDSHSIMFKDCEALMSQKSKWDNLDVYWKKLKGKICDIMHGAFIFTNEYFTEIRLPPKKEQPG